MNSSSGMQLARVLSAAVLVSLLTSSSSSLSSPLPSACDAEGIPACPWLWVRNAKGWREVNGLYKRSLTTRDGVECLESFLWLSKLKEISMSRQSGTWIIQSAGSPQCYFMSQNGSNPVELEGSWSLSPTCNTTSNLANEEKIRISCLATLDSYYSFETKLHEVWSFGSNFYGELARADGAGAQSGQATPAHVQELEGETLQVSLGCHHGMARLDTATSKLWTWGSNLYGQLGRSDRVGTISPNWQATALSFDTVTQMAAGDTFSVFITLEEGQKHLYSVGSNRYGQLGRESGFGNKDAYMENPRRVDMNADSILELVVGSHHVVVLNASGVYTWGDNTFGQLGRAGNAGGEQGSDYRILPIDTTNMGQASVTKVAAGRYHSVLLTDQGLYCFGSNYRGQCGPIQAGNGMSADETIYRTPIQIDSTLFGGCNAASIYAGQFTTFVQCDDGRVWGFGRNYHGMLTAAAGGYGTGASVFRPFLISSDSHVMASNGNVSQVAAGSDHAAFLVRVGEGEDPLLFLSGANHEGQIAMAASQGADISSFQLFDNAIFGCAGQVNGSSACDSGFMQAYRVFAGCDQTFVTTRRPPCPPGSFSETGLQPCSICPAGKYQDQFENSVCKACLQGTYSEEGSSVCLDCAVGKNTTGDLQALGVGCLLICPPGSKGNKQVVGDQGLSPCSACPIDSFADVFGSVDCLQCSHMYGTASSNATTCYPICPPGTFSTDGLAREEPCSPCPAGRYQNQSRQTFCYDCDPGSFSASNMSSCVTCQPGSYQNSSIGTTCVSCPIGFYQDGPASVACRRCPNGTTTRYPGVGSLEYCSRLKHRIFGFGNNQWGQLGTGSEQQVLLAHEAANFVTDEVPGLDKESVLLVSSGFSHSLFLTVENRLWASGDNFYGQLGFKPSLQSSCYDPDQAPYDCEDRKDSHPFPVEIQRNLLGAGTITKIIAGRYISAVLNEQGQVYTFGFNRYGQLGRAENVGTELPSWLPQPIAGMRAGEKVVDIAAGDHHLLLRTDQGRVLSVGLNRHGQLGYCASAGSWQANFAPTEILHDRPISSMAAGRRHSLLLTQDGNILAFGSNAYGQLGTEQGRFERDSVSCSPQLVDLQAVNCLHGACSRISKVAAGRWFSLLLSESGQLLGFGSNQQGQLLGPDEKIGSPTQVDLSVFGRGSVVDLSAGSQHTVLLVASGWFDSSELWLFGSNGEAQLDVHPTPSSYDNQYVRSRKDPCSFLGADECPHYRILSVSAGNQHTVVQLASHLCIPGSSTASQGGRPSLASPCLTCAAGKYSNSSGQLECLACPEGFFSHANATACVACAPATFSFPGSSTCSHCQLFPSSGQLDSAGASQQARCCLPGQFCASDACEVCSPCPAGSVSETFGARSCSLCPQGKFASPDNKTCESCQTGKSTAAAGSQSPGDCYSQCGAGTRSASPSSGGLEPCVSCERGKYSGGGETFCEVCPEGFDTVGENSTSCVRACAEGFWSETGAEPCLRCPLGQFRNSSACSPCPAGTLSSMLSPACLKCEPGFFSSSPGSSACVACSPGFFLNESGGTSCEACPAGFISDSNGSSSCVPCEGGWSTSGMPGMTACSQCAAGSFSSQGDCLACPPGSFSLLGSARCSLCPLGTFNPSSNATSCYSCSNSTTVQAGAQGSSSCVALTSARLSLSAPRANEETDVLIEFSLHLSLLVGDQLLVSLPEFDGRDGELVMTTETKSSNISFSAEWSNANWLSSNSKMVLTVRSADDMFENDTIKINVSKLNGIRSPMMGVKPCNQNQISRCFTIRAVSHSGITTPNIQFDEFPTFGSFGNSPTMMWAPATGSLLLSWSTFMPLRLDDVFLVHLPCFTADVTTVALQGMSRDLFAGQGMWNASSRTLEVALRGCSDRRGGVCFKRCIDLASTEDLQPCDQDACFKSEETFSIQVLDLSFSPSSCQVQDEVMISIGARAAEQSVLPTPFARICRSCSPQPTLCCKVADLACLRKWSVNGCEVA